MLTSDQSRAQEAPAAPAVDLMLVLDNSKSMHLAETPRRTRQIVSEMLRGGSPTERVGAIIFSQGAKLVLPLTSSTDQQLPQKVSSVQKGLTYRAPRTNPALALERALYELKHQGRPEAHKAVVLVTNGVMNVGDRVRDLAQSRWLKETLAEKGRQDGVRIFGIVFADTADVELLQTLGHTTGGDYYRVTTAAHLRELVRRIRDAAATPLPALVPPPPQMAPSTSTALSTTAEAPIPVPSVLPPVSQLSSAEPLRGALLWLSISACAMLMILAGLLGGMLRQLSGIRRALLAVPGGHDRTVEPVARVVYAQEETTRPAPGSGEQAASTTTDVCVTHPLIRATDVCAVCQKSYCALCLVFREGRRVCRSCLGERNVRLWFRAPWTK